MSGRRIEPQAGETIDRGCTVRFRFDGRRYEGYAGDTIASALTAAGVQVLSRSFKYHRPRGLLCGAGHCPNCLVQVGDEPNVRACRRAIEEGMEVAPQNAWPSLRYDAMTLTEVFSRFLPVGFYYKTFIRPAAMWPVYEHVLRSAAGLGVIDQETPEGDFDKQYLHADVAVVGGGPAGLSAAVAAVEKGARVLLMDENEELGGHLRFSGDGEAGRTRVDAWRESLTRGGATVLTQTAVIGHYQNHWLSAVRGNRLYKIRAGAVVVATGAFEIPMVFDGNDRPGVLLGTAVQRLVRMHGVAPGRRAVIVTTSDAGWDVAADLVEAGVEVAALADERPGPHADQRLDTSGAQILQGHTIGAAYGRRAVRAALLVPVGGDGPRHRVDCDLIAVSTGWNASLELAYLAGARSRYDEDLGEMQLQEVPDGMYLAGRVAGPGGLEQDIGQGREAGHVASLWARGDSKETGTAGSGLMTPSSPVRARSSRQVAAPATGHDKRFVCYCEDVTDVDIDTALLEGYDRIELLKRYTALGMGPCQGRMCGLQGIRHCARGTDTSVADTGRTTTRPPVTPVTLGVLAGQRMDPVQLSALHDWHVQQGARMMVSGLWLRPEHYGDPVAEVGAVRQAVGLIDVSPLGKLQLTGPGVALMLERLYVNQWRDLRRGRVRYGIMCNDEGVVLDDGVCARLSEEEWYVSTTSTGAAGALEWMEWWRQSGWGDGVHITDMTETHAAFNLAGPHSRQVLQQLTERDLSKAKFPYMRARRAHVAGVPCLLLRIGFTGELSYEIHCPAGFGRYLWERLMEAGQSFGLRPFGVEAQRVLRLEKAHFIVGQDTDALSDPIAAGADWAVRLDKDDFLGKRALTRVSAEGPRQRLVGFRTGRRVEALQEGLQIVDADRRIIGWISSCRHSPTLGETLGLCWLPADLAAREQATFTVFVEGRLETAQVHHGPFYDPEGARLRS
jgi:sarcosine oxidase subunit alpha